MPLRERFVCLQYSFSTFESIISSHDIEVNAEPVTKGVEKEGEEDADKKEEEWALKAQASVKYKGTIESCLIMIKGKKRICEGGGIKS